jgi:hypothetical protein
MPNLGSRWPWWKGGLLRCRCLRKKDFPGIEATEFDALDKVYHQNSVDWLNAQFYVKVDLQTACILLSFVLEIGCAIIASFLPGLRIAKMPNGEALSST